VRISALLPAFEEAENLRPLVVALTRALEALVASDWEILIVASRAGRDGTLELAASLAREDSRIRLVEQAAADAGYGRALALGIERARGDWLLLMDADGQLDPSELGGFFAHCAAADAIVGFRARRRDAWARRAASRLYGAAVRAALGVGRVRDVDCAFKLIRSSCLQGLRLRSRTGAVNAEILAHALSRGARLVELPVTHQARPAGRSRFEMRLGGLGPVPHPSEAIAVAREVAALALRRIVARSSA
jgi:glycosyltransferase involved in cell wall biosynthesis